MKKRGIILVFALLLFANVFVSGAKVSPEVYDSLSEEKTVRVFIKIDEESKNTRGFSTKSLENSKSIKDELKIIHDFPDAISVEINLSQLKELEDSQEVLEILPVRTMSIFLDVSIPVVSGNSVWKKQIEGTNLTGTEETVCILDTGIDFTHPALTGKNMTGIIDCMNENCIENCSMGDWHGHGTHVAGIVSSQNEIYRGISPGANLIGVSVLGSDGSGSEISVAKGIYWCIENSEKYNISVISMSLGSTNFYSEEYCDSSSYLATPINLAISKNISVVVATGNNYTGNPNKISSPACIENSTRVSAIKKDRTAVTFANRGNFFLDTIFAPGASIRSTVLGGGYGLKSGTSMATPHVSGAVAILNQYRKLEGLPKLTPEEITNLLVFSGEELYDSSSGGTYTILNVSNLILNADEMPPKISIKNPENDSKFQPGEINFSFNVSDLQNTNVSFYIWNSSNDLIDSENFSFSGGVQTFDYSIFLEEGNYFWSLHAIDSNNNENYLGNYTIYVGGISLNNFSPQNGFIAHENYSEFSCEFNSPVNELSNITFYLWNSSELIQKETKHVSGNLNSSTFNWTFENEGEYVWTCEPRDTKGSTSKEISNYSFTYDSPPKTSLSSPNDGSTYNRPQEILFKYRVEEKNLANCSLYINDLIVSTDNSSNQGEKNFSYSLDIGNHRWKIEYIDKASNSNISEERQITIKKASTSSGGGKSSSSNTKKEENNENTEITLSSAELKEGITKYLSKGQSARFSIKNKEHRLVVKEFYEKIIYLDIFSDPINVLLEINSPKKIDLNSDGIYDLEIIYSGTYQNQSNLFLNEIEEEIPKEKEELKEETPREESKKTETNTDELEIKEEKSLFSILLPYFTLIVLSLLGILIIIKIVRAISSYLYS